MGISWVQYKENKYFITMTNCAIITNVIFEIWRIRHETHKNNQQNKHQK